MKNNFELTKEEYIALQILKELIRARGDVLDYNKKTLTYNARVMARDFLRH